MSVLLTKSCGLNNSCEADLKIEWILLSYALPRFQYNEDVTAQGMEWWSIITTVLTKENLSRWI